MKRLRSSLAAVVVLFTCCADDPICEAATDTDVTELRATRVVIEEDKITITAEARVNMVIITPDAPAKSVQFTGRNSVWIKIKADQATFTIGRLGKGQESHDEQWAMSVKVAEDLKAGKEIGRIGFYRPEVIIRKNRIHSITGGGYLFPRRDP